MRSFRRTFGQAFPRGASAPLLVSALVALASGCGEASNGPSAPASVPAAPTPSAPAPQVNTGLTLVSLLTYDGSGQAVHPDVASTPPGWSATTTHVVATPYPAGQPRFENPSYYDVPNMSTWVAPANVKNPIAMPSEGIGYLSDPDMVYDPDTRLLSIYYREVTDSNRIFLIQSNDGTHWSTRTMVLAVPKHFAVSPSIVRRGAGDWLMWVVNAGTDGCTASETSVELRRSIDGIHWGEPESVRIGHNTESPWHIDVEWIPSRHEYWAVYNAKTHRSCMTELVRFATSPDGVAWTEYPTPLIRAGAISAFNEVVYRASIAYDSTTDVVTVLYSGARTDSTTYNWQVATEQLDLRTLMARVTAPQPMWSAQARQGARVPSLAPPLTNETAP